MTRTDLTAENAELAEQARSTGLGSALSASSAVDDWSLETLSARADSPGEQFSAFENTTA